MATVLGQIGTDFRKLQQSWQRLEVSESDLRVSVLLTSSLCPLFLYWFGISREDDLIDNPPDKHKEADYNRQPYNVQSEADYPKQYFDHGNAYDEC